MPSLLGRVALKALVLAFGALAGLVVGVITRDLLAGVLGGMLLAGCGLVLQQVWRGRELLAWLRGPQRAGAPRDEGFWGELGYRIERALRQKDLQLVQGGADHGAHERPEQQAEQQPRQRVGRHAPPSPAVGTATNR